MRGDDLLGMCWRMVVRNRRRYRAVIVAISIGTIGFIMIRTLSSSVEDRISGNLELVGRVTVLSAVWDDRSFPYHPGEYIRRDTQKLRELKHVACVAPMRYTDRDLKVQVEKRLAYFLQITCVDQNYWDTITAPIVRGRCISASDVERKENVCVLGNEAANELFGRIDPLGQIVSVRGYRYRVIGALGEPTNEEVARSVFVPFSLASQHMGQLRQVMRVEIKVDNVNKVEEVRQAAQEVLRELHPVNSDAVMVMSHSSRLSRVQFIMFIVKVFCYAALAAIFIVGKTGLTNVMLEAVKDRTREIGLRKALGATDSLIRMQFVIESVLVSAFAGAIGVIGGVTSVLLSKNALGIEASGYVLSASIIIDLCVTLIIGVAAGLYPSSQASRLDIATAMRFE